MRPLDPRAWRRAHWAARARRHARLLATITELELEHAATYDAPHRMQYRTGRLNVTRSS